MKKKDAGKTKKRPGIYMYCSPELKKRIDRARRFTNRTVTGYMAEAVMKQLREDEANMEKSEYM